MTTTHAPVLARWLFLLASGALLGCSGGGGTPDASTAGAAGSGTAGAAGTGGAAGGGATGAAGSGGGGVAGTGAGGGQSGTVGSGVAGSGGSGVAGSGGSGVAGSGGSGVAGTGIAGAAGGGSGGVGGGGRGGGAGAGGGAAGGTSGAAGRGGASGGTGGGAGTTGTGGSATLWRCPQGPFTNPFPLTGTPTRVTGVPPSDSFNNNGNDFGIIEGAVWFGDALYLSEIASGSNPPPARILRVSATGAVSIAYPMSGTNGLAIDVMGRLIGVSHTAGAVLAFNLANMTSTPIVAQYMGNRFNTPNDLAVHSNGTIYFTDPTHQAPSPAPQQMTRVYRLPPGSTTAVVVDATLNQPNGIMLSLDEAYLYVSDGGGRYRFPVNADGSLGARSNFPANSGSSDGMGIDCQGNLYYTTNNTVQVVSPTGSSLGSITVSGVQQVTNVAFGGADHQTLYITALGSGTQKGLFRLTMPLPGMPY